MTIILHFLQQEKFMFSWKISTVVSKLSNESHFASETSRLSCDENESVSHGISRKVNE